MLLSKRWQFLWTLVPRLVYDDSYQNPEYGRFSRFVDRSLFMNEAPVIETLRFKLGQICGSGDIQVWIRAAHKCCVRELIIEIVTYPSSRSPVTLPKSLYTCCRMLVTLKLSNAVLVDDVASSVSFPSFPGDEFVNRLLSSCPVLEDLVVNRSTGDNVAVFNIIVPSLKSLVLHGPWIFEAEAHGFVIDAPSLELLDVLDTTNAFFVIRSNMPKIVEANVVISCDHPEQIMGSITSVKRLCLCVKDAYPAGSIFCCLLSLKICTCETEWLNLLMHVLRDSPKLRTLKFEKCRGPENVEPRQSWIEPSAVPECLSSSLETVEWVKYKGTEEEKEVVAFILRNGSCLKTGTINPLQSTSHREKFEMIKELAFFAQAFAYFPACV
ncbi:probable FBD-associated F-box protein At1g32375 isoform X2 [Eutrema salsugineum]|nr:probable FBD-associated F-box protein At1g32375 isoform X2 [Eutrema salsugineum]